MLIKNLESIGEIVREFIKNIADRRVFAFKGEMGSGKTTFIKAICEELGVKDVINSPTFAIINEYFSEKLGEPVYHFDFYRIESPADALRIGIADYFDSGYLCFMEWAEKIESLLPENTVYIVIKEEADGERSVEIDK
jgi:tRNA threonylcarbamoyladenosine biosynthesis protein TsaE